MLLDNKIVLALAKGYILEEALPLLQQADIHPQENPNEVRKLIIPSVNPNVSYLIVRASDVITYVSKGVADLGIVGKDNILEEGCEDIYEVLDLQLAKCRLVLASKEKHESCLQGKFTVATKYVNITNAYFLSKKLQANIIKLYGSMELAPLTGMSDYIVDLVATGKTLKANKLKILEEITDISSYLIANQISYKTKFNDIQIIKNILADFI